MTLCAFDLLELNGKDLRRRPIEERKRVLAKLLGNEHLGIALNQHCEGDGAIIYKRACPRSQRPPLRRMPRSASPMCDA